MRGFHVIIFRHITNMSVVLLSFVYLFSAQVLLATLPCVKLLVLRNMQPPVIPNIAVIRFAKSILSCFDCICYASLHPP